MNKKNSILLFIFSLLLTTFSILPIERASASYVLPYPSYMPGNKLYRISRAVDAIKKYWYFGSIAKTKYYLSLSDKYLVEAKTLFEYKQYVLALDALQRSNQSVQQLNVYFFRSEREGKDIHQAQQTVSEAMSMHEGALKKLMEELPQEYVWVPEKQTAQALHIGQELLYALIVRMDIRQQQSK